MFFEKPLWNIKWVLWIFLQVFSETFLIVGITEQDIKNACRSPCQAQAILVRYEQNLNFLDRFFINTQIWTFIKTRLVGAESFHVDRRTDRHEKANMRRRLKKNLNICFVVAITHFIFNARFEKKKRIQFSQYLKRGHDHSHVACHFTCTRKLHVKVRVIYFCSKITSAWKKLLFICRMKDVA
jgi:hypothetical protein